MGQLKLLAASSLLALTLTTANALATAYTESGDAPQFFGSGPQNVGTIGNGDTIGGTIPGNVDDDGDLYAFALASSGLVSISVTPTGDLAPAIYLFDAAGGGIAYGSGGTGSNPLISVFLNAGTYNIGIGDTPLEAIDTAGNVWNGGAVPASFGTLDQLYNSAFIDPGGYTISFAISADEASPLALLAFGLAGLGFTAQRRKAKR